MRDDETLCRFEYIFHRMDSMLYLVSALACATCAPAITKIPYVGGAAACGCFVFLGLSASSLYKSIATVRRYNNNHC